jgi:hypothetical protein
MTVTLDLPPDKEAAFKAQAQARGLSAEQWKLEIADQQVQPASIARRADGARPKAERRVRVTPVCRCTLPTFSTSRRGARYSFIVGLPVDRMIE